MHSLWQTPSLVTAQVNCARLAKIKFKAFPKRVGPRILLVESVDYFETSKPATEWYKQKNKQDS